VLGVVRLKKEEEVTRMEAMEGRREPSPRGREGRRSEGPRRGEGAQLVCDPRDG
jgi:hypothetical protein